MKLFTHFLISGFAACVLFFNLNAQAKVYIDIEAAQVKKSLLALPPIQFYGSSTVRSDLEKGQSLFEVISNDLSVSGYFEFIKQDAFLENVSKVGLKPAPANANGFDFSKWTSIGSEFLIRAGYRVTGGNINLEAYLYYVPEAKLVFGKAYEGPMNSLRKIAHTFANDVVEQVTGKKTFFNTKFVVASNHGGLHQRGIFVMDWDGQNVRSITVDPTVHISPAWSADGKQVAYTAYAYHPKAKTRNADLFLYELASGKRWLVSYRMGINSGAEFTSDGKSLYITLSQNGNPDIYKMSLDGRDLNRITNGPNHAMNVEPALTQDMKRIAFSSDRSGRPMIYSMNTSGGDIKRLTIAGKYNATPSWSPDGKKLVFAGYDQTHFDIFTMNSDGTGMVRLTSAKKPNGKWADNESPSFSPDGRSIVFSSNRSGTEQLYIIGPDGNNERRITFDRWSYVKPKWSTFLD